ncbi:MAG TPA: MASE1 domain-containing protein [Pyrinomonadaceae bacterium]|nr:MASE1 domain-containing protein [Pyrinomonadaceae bacterium]
MSDPIFRRTIVTSLIVSVAYYVTAKVGFRFALQPGSVSTLWMPNSVLLAGLLLTPSRWWWLVISVTLPAHLASELQSGVPTVMVLSWFLSNSSQALIGAALMTYFASSDIRLGRSRDLTIFLICCALLAPLLASFLDSSLVKLNGWGNHPFWEIWRLRFLSNVLATLIIVPFVIEWVQHGKRSFKQASRFKYLEATVLFTTLFIVSFFVFTTRNSLLQTPALLYCPLPFLVWATIRFGLRGVSSALLIVMVLAIIGAADGTGPFIGNDSAYRALSIQAFLIVVSVPLFLLVAVIEERQIAEAAARDNEERLTLALNAAQMDTWDWQIAQNHVRRSPTGGDAGFSYGSSATLDSFYSFLHPDDLPIVQSAIAQALDKRTPYQVEFRVVLNDRVFWYQSKGKVSYDATNKPTRMLGVAMDITDRKRAEQDVAEINARNQAILRAIPDAMFLQTNEGVYVDYYTRDPRFLLVSPKEFLGKNVNEVLPPELAQRVVEAIRKVTQGEEPQVLEYCLPINNEERYFEARLVSAEGIHVLSMVRDVTDAHRAAESLRQSEARLLQSTRQIRALAAQLITAQESERRRIAILLHDDVGQNIATLGLAVSRLKRRPPATREALTNELEQLARQVDHLTTQIRQLSHELHPEVLEHVGLITALESHLTELEQNEDLQIKFSAEVATDPIPQDIAACLYRVAREAVLNVSKHSGANSADVVLKEIDGSLVLEVSDPGHGFDLEKVRLGSGLGLASSEERVKNLRGSLEIRSDSQIGTCVTARVPLQR